MKAVGIVAEYNPFHNGHKYHIEKTRELTGADTVVCVMSGNFVQRGEPAIYDKWLRAEAAVNCGADLVLELPVVYSCSGAEFFAKGAIKILDSLNCLDGISFGAECNELDSLKEAAELLIDESSEFKECIKKYLNEGNSYALSRSKALAEVGKVEIAQIVEQPNNILAVEYLKQLSLLGSNLRAISIKRKSAEYYSTNEKEGFAGGGRLRDMLYEGKSVHDLKAFIPAKAFSLFNAENPLFSDEVYSFILYKLISEDAQKLACIDGVIEGLENRAKKAAETALDYESLINLIKTKRYSRTSIQRMLMKILLGIESEDMQEILKSEACYGRILAFTSSGAKLIKEIKKNDNARIEMITNINKTQFSNSLINKMIQYDIKSSQIYGLIKASDINFKSDYKMTPYIK